MTSTMPVDCRYSRDPPTAARLHLTAASAKESFVRPGDSMQALDSPPEAKRDRNGQLNKDLTNIQDRLGKRRGRKSSLQKLD